MRLPMHPKTIGLVLSGLLRVISVESGTICQGSPVAADGAERAKPEWPRSPPWRLLAATALKGTGTRRVAGAEPGCDSHVHRAVPIRDAGLEPVGQALAHGDRFRLRVDVRIDDDADVRPTLQA